MSGFRGLGRLNLDARTQTAYGTLRAFVRFEIANRSGHGILRSGTQERYGLAFPGLGVDTFGRAQTFVNVDKAFVQFAGLTAGRASSFFDFYAHDLEFVGLTSGSDVSSTNLIAYTATLGGGLSATLSMEDPTARRNPVFNQGGVFGLSTGLVGTIPAAGFGGNGANVFVGNPQAVAPVGVTFDPVTGLPTVARLIDVVQRNGVPDFVGALRLDQPWGSAQLSGAVHEIQVGNFDPNTGSVFAANGTASFPGAFLTPFGNNTAGTGFVSPLAVAPVASNVALTDAGDHHHGERPQRRRRQRRGRGRGSGPASGQRVRLGHPGRSEAEPAVHRAGRPPVPAGRLRRGRRSPTPAPSGPLGGEVNANNFTNRFVVNTDDAAVDAFGRST